MSSYQSNSNAAEQKEVYMQELLSQGQDRLNICPNCYATGQREKYCCNLVLINEPRKGPILVCCYFGDKASISKKAFKKKLKAMKKYKKWHMKIKA